MKLIGLTGGMGSGKSTVSGMLRKLGFTVLDADIFAREVVEEGSFGLKSLVQIFGSQILDQGQLRRGEMARLAFHSEENRRVVERILHPLIQWRFQQESKRHEAEGEKIIFYDAALIFERDRQSQFDAVIVVYVPEPVQMERIKKRDKFSDDEITQRLSAQISMAKKAQLTPFVVDNSGTTDETFLQVEVCLEQLGLRD